jgi:hypothetical protein
MNMTSDRSLMQHKKKELVEKVVTLQRTIKRKEEIISYRVNKQRLRRLERAKQSYMRLRETWSFHSKTKDDKYYLVLEINIGAYHVGIHCPESFLTASQCHARTKFRSACLRLWDDLEDRWRELEFENRLNFIEWLDWAEIPYKLTDDSDPLTKCKVCDVAWALEEDYEGDWYCSDCYVTHHDKEGHKVNPNI